MPNQTPTQPTALDPDAVNLAKAIRQTESGGNFNAKGASGEGGAYQFMPDTWANYSKQAGINVPLAQATPEQQNQVAYTQIKKWKDAGYNPGQIASMWNAGEGKPNAYLEGNAGVNDKGVSYDTAAYAKKVATAYQSFKGSPQTASVVNSSNSDSNPLGAQTADASTGQKPADNESILGKLIDFAFPIANDFSGAGAQKTALQKLGDAGLSALWFVPGIGEGAEAAIRGAGLLGETGAKIAGQALGGAATGYASDVASKLSSGDTNAGDVLTPGLGTATGGLLGGVLGKVGSKYSKSGVLESVGEKNNGVIGQTKRGANELAESFSEDKNPGALMAQKGINLPATVNPETVAYDTASHAQGLRDDANVLTDTLTTALEKVPGSIKATDLEDQLVNKLSAEAPDKITASEQAQLIHDEFSKIRSQYGENLSAADLNELKKRAWNLSKFDAATPNLIRKTQRVIGNNLKTSVEDLATKNGMPDVKAMNEYIGQHLDAADHLDRVNGMKAPGGRLGDLLKGHVGAELGGAAGFFGGGPVGALMGALAGHYGGKLAGSAIRKLTSSPLKNVILNRIMQEDPEFVQKISQYAKQTPQGLETIRQQLAQQGIKLFNKETPKAAKAASKAPGLLSKVGRKSAKAGLITSGTRAGSQFNSPVPTASK